MAYTFTTLKVTAPTATRPYVATVTLCNGRGNAMSQVFFRECAECFQRLAMDSDVRAIVLEGAGKYFTVGLDLKDAAASNLGGADSASRDVARKFLHQRQSLLAVDLESKGTREKENVRKYYLLLKVCKKSIACLRSSS